MINALIHSIDRDTVLNEMKQDIVYIKQTVAKILQRLEEIGEIGQSSPFQQYGSESRPSSHWIGLKDDDVAVKAVMKNPNEATVAKF